MYYYVIIILCVCYVMYYVFFVHFKIFYYTHQNSHSIILCVFPRWKIMTVQCAKELAAYKQPVITVDKCSNDYPRINIGYPYAINVRTCFISAWIKINGKKLYHMTSIVYICDSNMNNSVELIIYIDTSGLTVK